MRPRRGVLDVFRAAFLDPDHPSSYLTLAFIIASIALTVAGQVWTVPLWVWAAYFGAAVLLFAVLAYGMYQSHKRLQASLERTRELLRELDIQSNDADADVDADDR